jgi:hypothetical protein
LNGRAASTYTQAFTAKTVPTSGWACLPAGYCYEFHDESTSQR